jgi:hypothetical protein
MKLSITIAATAATVAALILATGAAGTVAPVSIANPVQTIVYGGHATLSGTATSRVSVWGLRRGTRNAFRVVTLMPKAGRWSVVVAPRAPTLYEAVVGTAKAQAWVTIRARLHVIRTGRTLRVEVAPVPQLAGARVVVLRREGASWKTFTTLRADESGVAVRAGLPDGSYQVDLPGGPNLAEARSAVFAVAG